MKESVFVEGGNVVDNRRRLRLLDERDWGASTNLDWNVSILVPFSMLLGPSRESIWVEPAGVGSCRGCKATLLGEKINQLVYRCGSRGARWKGLLVHVRLCCVQVLISNR